MLIIFRKTRIEIICIERGVGFEQLLEGLQLRSTSVDVEHSGYVRFLLVGWWRTSSREDGVVR